MRLKVEENQSMLDDLNIIRRKLNPLLKDFNLKTIEEVDGLHDFIETCDKVKSQLKASKLNQSKINLEPIMQYKQVKSMLPMPSVSEIGELINLLGDLFQGKGNDYLQEVLKNAELYLKVQPKDEDDPNSRKVLTINIQLAATVIDKYAHLLEVILGKGQKNFLQDQQNLIATAYNNVLQADRRLEELQRARFCMGLKYLLAEAELYIDHHKGRACCFGLFKKKPTQQYKDLINWFDELSQQPLSAPELAGAIYFIRDQISMIHLTGEYEAIRDSLDKLLKENNYPAYSKQDPQQLIKHYMETFVIRAEVINFNLFSLIKQDEHKLCI
ncbi:Uncharacterised protein [Legionella busanensis]|uniref:Uncharacterized protein n=1 Tax=Legionella busanensis TaxID=190655 RepID=A0A378JJF0_9GAMM|nr:hypothetical protein [Legionella busanensis]STX50443.1 Uncharacterised protein [Legionella busanensis]